MLQRLLLAGVLVLGPAQSPSQEGAPPVLAQAVPKEAFFLLQAKDLDGLRSDFEGGAWYAFYRDEDMKGLRGWIEGKVEEEKGKETESGLEFDPWEFLRSVHGSMTAFGVEIPGSKEPALGVLVDPGEPRGAFEDVLAKVLEHGREASIPSSDAYAGVELKVFERKPRDRKEGQEDESPPEESDAGTEHSAIFESSGATCFVVAASREHVLETAHGIIDRLSGKDASKGVEGSDLLAQARRSVASPGRLEVFLDLEKAIRMIQAVDPPDAEGEKVIHALGVDDLHWLYAAGDIGKGEHGSFDVSIKFPEKGFLRDWLGFLGTISLDTARMAPRDCSAVTLAQFDVWGLWESAWKLAAAIDADAAEQARAQMDAGLEQFGGGEFEQSFLSQLDGRFLSFGIQVPEEEWKAVLTGVAADPGSGTATSLGHAMVIGLEDAQEVAAFLQSVLEHVGVSEMVKTEEFQGNTIHKLSLGAGPGFQWAFTKKAGILSQFPTALRAALRMEGADKKDSALEKESFKPHFEAHRDAGMLGLTSTPEMLKGFLNGIENVRGVLATTAKDVPFPPMPSPVAVDRHFKGTLVSTVTRTDGVLRFHMASR